jgi:hypothetical protein
VPSRPSVYLCQCAPCLHVHWRELSIVPMRSHREPNARSANYDVTGAKNKLFRPLAATCEFVAAFRVRNLDAHRLMKYARDASSDFFAFLEADANSCGRGLAARAMMPSPTRRFIAANPLQRQRDRVVIRCAISPRYGPSSPRFLVCRPG